MEQMDGTNAMIEPMEGTVFRILAQWTQRAPNWGQRVAALGRNAHGTINETTQAGDP